MPTSPGKSSKPREDNVVSSYLAVNKAAPLNVSKVEKFELINLDSPFHSESKRLSPPNSAFGGSPIAQSSRQEFETIWAGFEDPKGAARGWSSSPPSAICTGLQEALPHYKFVVAPDSQSPFIEGAYAQRSQLTHTEPRGARCFKPHCRDMCAHTRGYQFRGSSEAQTSGRFFLYVDIAMYRCQNTSRHQRSLRLIGYKEATIVRRG